MIRKFATYVAALSTAAVMSDWRAEVIKPRRPAPNLGEDTREVLAEAGHRPSEIDALIAEGAAL